MAQWRFTAGTPFAVGLQDVLDVGRVGDVGGALVMDDDVEVLVPVRPSCRFRTPASCPWSRRRPSSTLALRRASMPFLEDFLLRWRNRGSNRRRRRGRAAGASARRRAWRSGRRGRSARGGCGVHGVSEIKGVRGSAGKRKTYFLGFGAGLGAVRAFLVSAIAALASSSGIGWPSTKACRGLPSASRSADVLP